MGNHDFHANPLSILVVCNANVCRSPAAEFALSASANLEVLSAGLQARDGTRLCPETTERIVVEPGGIGFIDKFASRSVHTVDMARFELILTATVSIRSELLRQVPELRDRMFTLVETRLLTDEALSADESDLFLDEGPGSILLRRRGSQPTGPHKSGLLMRRNQAPLDIVDSHGSRSRRRHQSAINASFQLGAEIGQAFTAWRTVPA